MVPLLQPIDYHRMYGRKLVLRLPHNQYDSITPPEDRDFFRLIKITAEMEGTGLRKSSG